MNARFEDREAQPRRAELELLDRLQAAVETPAPLHPAWPSILAAHREDMRILDETVLLPRAGFATAELRGHSDVCAAPCEVQ